MHSHVALLNRLFSAIDQHDLAGVAACYHPYATFRDIAFDLKNKDEIVAMWQMIFRGDLRCSFRVADNSKPQTCSGCGGSISTVTEKSASVFVTDVYTFSKTQRRVFNEIVSHFEFAEGLIIRQADCCDAKRWAKQAWFVPFSWAFGRSEKVRRGAAMGQLKKFIAQRDGHSHEHAH